MIVSGFTFIRNAAKFDYPVVEAINSILTMCDEVVVAVGNSDDETLQMIQRIDSEKIKIVQTIWDDSLREGGRVLAAETMKAFNATRTDADWCFYIQGDEVVHEKYHSVITQAMEENCNNQRIQGLLFDYLHFYGSYDYVANSRKWYSKEVRIIRRNQSIYSFRDAQGFQCNGRPLYVKKIEASVYHYGWVKPPDKQQLKQQQFHKMWHNDEWVSQNVKQQAEFDYSQIDSLAKFTGTHPLVMQPRIKSKNWNFEHDISYRNLSLKHRFYEWVERYFNWRIGEYRNYRLVKGSSSRV
nr:glycosyltransferase family 2 protein [Bacteroidota bacterium]